MLASTSQSAFFGRHRELDWLLANARFTPNGFITILGPPGAGKTRLARELLARMSGKTEFIDLTAFNRIEDLVLAIDGDELHQDGLDDALREVASRWATCDLVVLDNAEHLLSATFRQHFPVLVQAMAGTPLIVTSRERLGLADEQVLELSFLPVGPEAPAMELFVDRARRLDPEFPRDQQDRDAALELTRSLGGCPLAIELAASRAARLGTQVIAEQVRQTGMSIIATRSDRYTSVTESVLWSWELLSELQREALAGLSMIPGAWRLEDAAAVLGTSSAEALDRIESLRDASLVRLDTDDRTKYRVYEIVREVVAERADDGARQRCFERLLTHITSPRLGASLFYDAPNPSTAPGTLHFVADECLRSERPTEALQALLRLHSRYGQRGPHASYATLLTRVAARLPTASADRAICALAQAEVEGWRGHFRSAIRFADHALEALPDDSDPELRAVILALRGRLAGGVYDPELALPSFEAAQLLLLGPSHQRARAWLQQQVAQYIIMYDPSEAETRIEAALAVFRQVNDVRIVLPMLTVLATSRVARGARSAAASVLRECDAVSGTVDDARSKGYVAMLWGVYEHEAGHLDRASDHYQTALMHLRECGSAWLIGLAHLGLGDAALEQGDLDEAEARCCKALELLRPLREHVTTVWALCSLGTLWARRGKLDVSKRYFDDAHRIAKTVPVVELVDAVRIRRLELEIAEASLAGKKWGDERWSAIEQTLHEASAANHFGLRFPAKRVSSRLEALRERAGQARLVVDCEGRWFTRDGRERIDLRRRKRLARVLARLVIAPSGEWISLDALFEAGWPGERCVPGSDVNRVHVTLSRLRSAGLDGLLESDAGRFRLKPDTKVVLEEAA